MWYFSLVLAILSLITAGQQSALIHTLVGREEDLFTNLHTKAILKLVAVNSTYASATKDSEPDDSSDSSKTLSVGDEQETQPSVIMMYMWQNPVMLMAWSVVIFLLGLTLHVTSPLRHDLSGINNRKTGIFFLTSGAIASLNFLWCNFWIYRVAQHGEDLENLTESGLMENKNVASTSVL
jgi:hypothetical protein